MEKGGFDLTGIPGTTEQEPSGLPGLPSDRAPGPAGAGGGTGHDLRAWGALIAAVVLTGIATLLMIGFAVEAAGPHHARNGGSQAVQIISAFVCAGLVILCGEWALRAEHRLRRQRGHPLAASFEAAAVAPAPSARARRQSRLQRRYGPGAMTFYTLLFTALFIACVIATLNTLADANRSDYVQHHGVLVSGTVINVDNMKSCGRYSCSYTAEITAQLARPFEGATTTVVHYPGFSDELTGDRLQLLIDSKENDYAELPGSPATKPAQWIGLAAGSLLFLAFAALGMRRLWQLTQQRRAHRAALGLPTAAGASSP